MRGFARRTTVTEALAWLDDQLAALPAETVAIDEAHGRVLAADVTSAIDVPAFDRAMMDGYAVVASDVQGASTYSPLELTEAGISLPGRPADARVAPGEAVRIMTGAPIPDGADAVLPFEKTRRSPEAAATSPDGAARRDVEVVGDVAVSANVGRRGEDVRAGTIVLNAGRRLRPQDVGLLSAVVVPTVAVVRRPRVRIITTGDELVPAGRHPGPFQIADANGPMLSALAERDGAATVERVMIEDDREAISAAMLAAPDDGVDVLLISGGSSVGQEDVAPVLLAQRGELAVHGIAMRPSSPAGMGRLGGSLVFLLPGNPVSCLCAYDFFAGRAIRVLGGRRAAWPYRQTRGVLRAKISSVIGRLDYCRVRIREDDAGGATVEPLAISGASVLSSTTRADGFVVIAADREGYPAGDEVDVYWYDDALGSY
ncbi:MAG: molybdopterin molybdotransferase MoeA [Pirellulales bacterium]